MFVAGLGTIGPAKEAGASRAGPEESGRSRSGTVNQGQVVVPESTSLAASLEATRLGGSDFGSQTPLNRSRAGSMADSIRQGAPVRDRADSTLSTTGLNNASPEPTSTENRPPISTDEFEILKDHLRKAFNRDSGKNSVWPEDIKPNAEGKVVRPSGTAMSDGGKQALRRMAWRTVLVDKVSRFGWSQGLVNNQRG